MQLNLFDARMLTSLVTFLDQNGAQAEAYLDRVRIPGKLIAEGGWVTKKQAYDLAYDVIHRLGRPDALFAAYGRFEFEHLGPIATAMRSCKTVKEALELGAQLGSTAYEGNQYFLKIDGETSWFCYHEPKIVSAGQTFINDMTLSVYYRLIQAAADQGWRPERILIHRDVINRHRTVENFEDCQASYHPDFSALAFPTKYLSRQSPWQRDPAERKEQSAWLSSPAGSEPIVDSLYRLLASCLPCRNLPTLDQVSQMVDVSPATLKRHLTSAGMSYRRLLDRIRFDKACEMLAIPQITIREIADELGYSGTNNFVRSFRRMTSLTPSKYRQQLVIEGGQG